jgi:glycosyltransferase involved in cell wall biosynthesis
MTTLPQADYTALLISFNSETTIARALLGIKTQRIAPSEIILVDDCSTDSTVEVAVREMKDHDNFRIIIVEQNSGQSFCRNLGVLSATTQFIMLFDDDDFSLPERSQIHLEHLRHGGDISFVSSERQYQNHHKVLCINRDLLQRIESKVLARGLLIGEKSQALGVYVPASTCSFSVKAWELTGGFDVKLRRLEDVDFAIKASLQQLKFHWSSKVGVIRYATIGPDKGGGIDTQYEKILLSRFQDLLEDKLYTSAITHWKTRHLYFSKAYFCLILHLLSHPIYGLKMLFLKPKVLSRIVHDLKIHSRKPL